LDPVSEAVSLGQCPEAVKVTHHLHNEEKRETNSNERQKIQEKRIENSCSFQQQDIYLGVGQNLLEFVQSLDAKSLLNHFNRFQGNA
jgi:hypothetical protein